MGALAAFPALILAIGSIDCPGIPQVEPFDIAHNPDLIVSRLLQLPPALNIRFPEEQPSPRKILQPRRIAIGVMPLPAPRQILLTRWFDLRRAAPLRVTSAIQNATAEVVPSPSLEPADGVNRIVIDAGHGGYDYGAIGAHGVIEKDVVLDVTLRLAGLLRGFEGADVLLTRDDDTFVSLSDRIAIANGRSADLFVSIHANSARSSTAAGTETFFLNFSSHRVWGFGGRPQPSPAITEKIVESQTLAERIQKSIFHEAARSNKAARNRGVKRAPFMVLVGASMPSILAEIGFLSNANDEANLARPEYRQQIAAALYRGICQYIRPAPTDRLARAIVSSDRPAGT